MSHARVLQTYLASLTEIEAERVLTRQMRPGAYSRRPDYKGDYVGPCLVGTASDAMGGGCISEHCDVHGIGQGDVYSGVEPTYDRACRMLGTERCNALIRDRLLSIMVSRRLTSDVAETVEVA